MEPVALTVGVVVAAVVGVLFPPQVGKVVQNAGDVAGTQVAKAAGQ